MSEPKNKSGMYGERGHIAVWIETVTAHTSQLIVKYSIQIYGLRVHGN